MKCAAVVRVTGTAMQQKPVVLITGSEGLIGDALVAHLSRDYRAAGFDIARPHKRPDELDFIDCDLTSDVSVARALEELAKREGSRLASVIHLAAYYDFTGAPSPLYRNLTIELISGAIFRRKCCGIVANPEFRPGERAYGNGAERVPATMMFSKMNGIFSQSLIRKIYGRISSSGV
jgi:hypothetical protein